MVIIAGCAEIGFLQRETTKMPVDNKSRILVVDDSGAVRSIVRKILSQLGFTDIDEAADGKAALAKINEQPYGLVISDWNMAPMNGRELLDHVRGKKEFNTLPFIMMTVEADQYKIIGAKYPGVTLFISKPFSVDDLQARIAQIDVK
jgi:two-component system chemotaxis response regulator CheY